LFLPAAGRFNGTSYYSGGSFGHYWSSTLDSNSRSTLGRSLYFRSDNVNLNPQGYDSRSYGFSVRAVRAVSE
jgi:hypothetical protein